MWKTNQTSYTYWLPIKSKLKKYQNNNNKTILGIKILPIDYFFYKFT